MHTVALKQQRASLFLIKSSNSFRREKFLNNQTVKYLTIYKYIYPFDTSGTSKQITLIK